jgi:hypothetical protein
MLAERSAESGLLCPPDLCAIPSECAALALYPERRSQDIDVIEDVIPLYDVRISVKAPQQVTGVTCVPEMEALPFEHNGDRVEFVVPKVVGHQMAAITF